MRFPIRARLLLFSLALILTGANLTAGIALYLQLDSLEEHHIHFGEELVEIIGQTLHDPLYNLEIHKLSAQILPLTQNDDVVTSLVLDSDGIVLTDGTQENPLFEEEMTPLLPIIQEIEEHHTIKIWERNNAIAITYPVTTSGETPLGYLHLELSREDIEESYDEMVTQFLYVELFLLLFSSGAAILLSNYFNRPIQQAVKTANTIASGDYSSPHFTARKDEFGDLSNALHQMANQIEESMTALHSAQQELEEIFRSMVDGVLVVDQQEKIQRTNRRLQELTGLPERELIGKPLQMLFNEEIHVNQFYGQGRESGMKGRKETELTAQVSGAPIQHSHLDQPAGSVLVIHDLSDRLRAESQEQYAAFQSGIAEMGASVLHNIGNVVTGMTGHIAKIQSHTNVLSKLSPALTRFIDESMEIQSIEGDPEPIRQRLDESIRVIRTISDSLERFNQNFTEDGGLSKIESSIRHIGDIISIQQSASRPVITATRFNMKQLIDDTFDLINDRFRKYDITWDYSVAPNIGNVTLPRNLLMQLLLNLLKNSLEAINEERETHPDLQGEGTLRVESESDHTIVITVTDNGCGISDERISEVFKPRYTTKSGGSGYGLHSAANFINQVGGTIQAASDGRHSGTTITLSIPSEVGGQNIDPNEERVNA